MPLNHYNPVLSGMMNAYGLADRLRQFALDKQRMEFELAREKRIQEEDQRAASQRDLATRLSLATNPALTEVGDEATRTIQGKILDPQLARAYGAPEVAIAGVPTEGAIEHGGRRYAVRSPQEQLQERLQEAAIMSQAENVSAADKARRTFEATAIPLPAKLAARVGLAPGTMVSSTVVDDLLRAAIAGEKEPTPVNWNPQMTDQGLVQVNPQTGEVRRPTLQGTRLTRPPSTATGELTTYQRGQQTRQQQQDQQAAQNRKRQELASLETEERKLMEEVQNIRGGLTEGGQLLTKDQVSGAQARERVKLARLRQIRKRKVELGFTTPQEAGLAGAAAGAVAAAEAPAAPKTWEDYKRAKGGQ